MDDERCRITVVGARRRVDLAVPSRAPIAEYVPELSRLCGQETDETFPASWSLAPPGAGPLPLSTSLMEARVVDGATLYLRDVVDGEADEPYVADLDEMVDEIRSGWDRWRPRHRAFSLIGIGLAVMVASVVELAFGSPGNPAVGIVAIAAGFGAPLLAGTAVRRRWPVPRPLRVAVALGGCPLLASAGYELPVSRSAAGAAALCIAVGALVGALAATVAVPDVCTLIVSLCTAIALPVTLLSALAHATPVRCAAVVGVAALVLLSVAPAAAGRLVALASAYSDRDTPADPAVAVGTIMSRGRGVLITLALVSSVAGGVCLLVLGSSGDVFAIGLAACLSVALLVQAGESDVPAAVMPPLVAGSGGLAVLAATAPVRLLGFQPASMTLLVLGAGAAVLGAGFALANGRSPDVPGERPEWFATTGAVLLAASVALAVGVFGVFADLAHLGGRL